MTYEDHIRAIAEATEEEKRTGKEFSQSQRAWEEAGERLHEARVQMNNFIAVQVRKAMEGQG
jgi:hypothetical protein